MFRTFTLSLILIVYGFCAKAQNITGCWEGDLGNDQFLQINVIQTGTRICGYTWDYVWGERAKSYCKQYFSGFYDAVNKRWYISGTSFMEQKGGHMLMETMFAVEREKTEFTMEGYVRVGGSFFGQRDNPMTVSLRRVSMRPATTTPEMLECIEEQKQIIAANRRAAQRPKVPSKPSAPIIKPAPVVPQPKPAPPKPAPPKPVPPKPKPPVQLPKPAPKPKADSIKTIAPSIITPPQVKPLPVATAGRTNKETGRIVVNDRKIKLSLYDNATVDGDSVTIYYNGKVIVQHQRLSEKPVIVELELDENISLHSIVMYAENLGSLPPNTALIVFRDSKGKRYELFAKATLEENAQLVFEYKPE